MILKLPFSNKINWKNTIVEFLIYSQAHWKKFFAGLLVFLAFAVKGYMLDVIAVNIGNSRLKTVQYVFKEPKKNIFVISGFLNTKEQKILTKEELAGALGLR